MKAPLHTHRPVYTRAELLPRLAAAVSQLPNPPAEAYLFGSYARDEATPTSDVDLLLLYPTASTMPYRERHAIKTHMYTLLGLHFDIVYLPLRGSLTDREKAFLIKINTERQFVYG